MRCDGVIGLRLDDGGVDLPADGTHRFCWPPHTYGDAGDRRSVGYLAVPGVVVVISADCPEDENDHAGDDCNFRLPPHLGQFRHTNRSFRRISFAPWSART